MKGKSLEVTQLFSGEVATQQCCSPLEICPGEDKTKLGHNKIRNHSLCSTNSSPSSIFLTSYSSSSSINHCSAEEILPLLCPERVEGETSDRQK